MLHFIVTMTVLFGDKKTDVTQSNAGIYKVRPIQKNVGQNTHHFEKQKPSFYLDFCTIIVMMIANYFHFSQLGIALLVTVP